MMFKASITKSLLWPLKLLISPYKERRETGYQPFYFEPHCLHLWLDVMRVQPCKEKVSKTFGLQIFYTTLMFSSFRVAFKIVARFLSAEVVSICLLISACKWIRLSDTISH